MANIAVYGIYATRDQFEQAVDQFQAEAFRSTDVAALLPANVGTKELGIEEHSKAPEGASIGAASGAVLGGTLGCLVGVGTVAVPGLGPLLAAGPLFAALSGAGAGAVVGGMTGALIGLGIPEYEAKRYTGLLQRGHILASVHADNETWAKKAKQILAATGAQHISETRESKGEYAVSDRPKPRRAA